MLVGWGAPVGGQTEKDATCPSGPQLSPAGVGHQQLRLLQSETRLGGIRDVNKQKQ